MLPNGIFNRALRVGVATSASLGCAMGLQVCRRFGWVFRLPPFNGLRDYRKTGQGSLKTVFPVFRLPQRVSAVI